MPKVRPNPHPTKGGTGGLAPVTPHEVDRVRRSVLDVVRKQIPAVREVLAGDRKWGQPTDPSVRHDAQQGNARPAPLI